MKIIKPLLTLIGALTVAGILAAAVLFFFAPALLQQEDDLEKADAIVVLGGITIARSTLPTSTTKATHH